MLANNTFSSPETNIESQPMVDTHSKRTLLIKTVETRDGQVGGNFRFFYFYLSWLLCPVL